MIDLREIYDTIDDLRRDGTTIGQAEKLALLYIAADYMERETARQTAQNYAHAADFSSIKEMPVRIRTSGRSDFLAACDGLPINAVLDVLDEHMEAISVLYPKEYAAIIDRLNDKRK